MSEPRTPVATLVVNGRHRDVSPPPGRRLIDVLRQELGLTGAKEGCGCGECGACTVLLDGEPVCSCLTTVGDAAGREITTVEGVAGGAGELHPVQRAFLAAGAVQCGYCTPGMVMAAVALLERDPDPSDATIREALSAHLCRCSGYQQLVQGVRMAARGEVPEVVPPRVGARTWREDGPDKVTGRTRYTADLAPPPGTLHAAVYRSLVAHAEVLEIDLADAREVPGVVDAFDHRAVPGEARYGNAVADQPVLAGERARFVGEALAVVVGETAEAARRGLERIKLVYRTLPAVTDPAAALEPAAPLVHAERDEGNLLCHLKLARGDVEGALAGAERVVERTYTTTWQEHACLETEAALAEPDGEGGLVVRCPSQNVFFDRLHICKALDLPRDKVRVIQQPTGAAFGGREDIYAQIHAALAAQRTGHPVRLVWSREESQVATTKRHPTTLRYRAGLDENGRIRGMAVDVLADTGAYASWGPNIARKALVHAAGPFAVDDLRVDVRLAYTNNGISGAFRGFGATQVTFGYACFAAELAREAGIPHGEFLALNHLKVGDRTATGQEVTGAGLEVCFGRAMEEAGPAPEPGRGPLRRGRGVASFLYGIGYGNAIPDIGSAVVGVLPDGRIEVRCGAVDYGQGARTLFLQIVGEALQVDGARIVVRTGDTHATPDSGSTVASRQTVVSGSAVDKAARAFRETLLDQVAGGLALASEDLDLDDRGVVAGGELVLPWSRVHATLVHRGARPYRQARYRLRSGRLDLDDGQGDAYGTYAFGCQVADVTVDTRTGAVTVDRIVAAHDVGRAINPAAVEGQIVGGTCMGLGLALLEEHKIEDGFPVTRNLDTYRIPGPGDMPQVVPLVVEVPDASGPFGARGIGEPAMVATAPAIANAVADALGVRVRTLPITPQRVWAAHRRED